MDNDEGLQAPNKIKTSLITLWLGIKYGARGRRGLQTSV